MSAGLTIVTQCSKETFKSKVLFNTVINLKVQPDKWNNMDKLEFTHVDNEMGENECFSKLLI